MCIWCLRSLTQVFKYPGVVTAGCHKTGQCPGEPGTLYWAKVEARMFNPHASLEVHCPFRQRAWSLSTPVFDYRSAQVSGALESRGGLWYSRRAEHVSGEMDLEYPLLKTAPDSIDARIRLSWWPPHVTVTWYGMDVYQKVSFRPVTGAPCDWKEIVFDASVFTDKIRTTYHSYFDPQATVTAPPCPPRSEPNLAPPSTERPVTAAPPSNPSDTVSQQSDSWTEEWDPEDWNGWSSDCKQSPYNDDWAPNTWWSRGGQWKPTEVETEDHVPWQPNEPLSVTEPVETSTAREPSLVVPAVIIVPPSAVEKSATEDTVPVSPFNDPPIHETREESQLSLPLDTEPLASSPPREYTVQESRQTIHTRSIRSIAGVSVDGSDEFMKMMALQQLAMRGPPITRDDRMARQVIANQLHLSPQMYNFLVFGEQDTDTNLPPSITDAPTNPPSP